MNRTGTAVCCAMTLAAGLALVSCGQAVAPSTAPVAAVDASVKQSVKNGCIEDLKAHASGEIPEPGMLHPPKVALVHLAFLSDVKQVTLPGGAAGYELGMEFVYKVGHDDSQTGRKLCRINLADSSVVWQPLSTPDSSNNASGGASEGN
jgi:hypothetical protein